MNKPRCPKCNHRPRRIVTATSKRKGSIPAEPRAHKKACNCDCHKPTSSVSAD